MDVTPVPGMISSSINPFLVLMILVEPALPRRTEQEAWPRFWLRAVLGIAIAVVLAEMGKRYEVWPGHPSFPSGHTTFATAAAVALVCRRGRRWAPLALAAVLLMGTALVIGHYHTIADIIGGIALAVTITGGPFWLRAR